MNKCSQQSVVKASKRGECGFGMWFRNQGPRFRMCPHVRKGFLRVRRSIRTLINPTG